MGFITVDQIMNADDLLTRTIPVPEWGGDVEIKQLTKAQQTEIRTAAIKDGVVDEQMMELGIIATSMINPNLTLEHVQILANKNSEVIDRVLGEVFLLSSMDKEALARAREDFQEGPDEVDGIPSGGEAGDDGEEIAPGTDGAGVHGVDSVPSE